jgi:peptidoglycan hydrolase CwlO-like protein
MQEEKRFSEIMTEYESLHKRADEREEELRNTAKANVNLSTDKEKLNAEIERINTKSEETIKQLDAVKSELEDKNDALRLM